jgi:hypothetical protein
MFKCHVSNIDMSMHDAACCLLLPAADALSVQRERQWLVIGNLGGTHFLLIPPKLAVVSQPSRHAVVLPRCCNLEAAVKLEKSSFRETNEKSKLDF